MRPCGLKLSAMNKRWLPILGMLVFSVSLHGQGSVVVFDEQQRFDVVDRYEPDGDTVSLWLSVQRHGKNKHPENRQPPFVHGRQF